jgi:hypothetical protein
MVVISQMPGRRRLRFRISGLLLAIALVALLLARPAWKLGEIRKRTDALRLIRKVGGDVYRGCVVVEPPARHGERVNDPGVTAAGIRKLRRVLPLCRIVHTAH